MNKHHHFFEYLIFLLILLFVLVSVFVVVQPSITGRTSMNTIKYISCRYWDTDSYGACLRVERQEGTECNPPMDPELTIGGKSGLLDLYKIYNDRPKYPDTVKPRISYPRPCADRVNYF
ncbi:hypothetical protein HYV79_01405 [Candidatus Woesearchaeota archaeon]|nr:hypothetical protein [Candidatus Woesearchaeota archaeon]